MALDLGKQYGPLPLGGWVAVIVGGLGIAYFINKNMADAEVSDESSVQLTESGVGGGGGQFIYDEPGSVTPDVENTNQAWGIKVTNWLISQNHSPAVADNAVRKYLSGMELTLAENALINLALVQFGTPPEPLPPTKVPETPSESGEKPNKVSNFFINSSKRRNDIFWKHDNKNVTHFGVLIIAHGTGATQEKTVPANHRNNSYSISHHAPPGMKKSRNYGYRVRPYNGDVAGPMSKIIKRMRA